MENKIWYAVQRNEEDGEQGTGSFEWDEAVKICHEYGYEQIAAISIWFDENSEEMGNSLCIETYKAGEDF